MAELDSFCPPRTVPINTMLPLISEVFFFFCLTTQYNCLASRTPVLPRSLMWWQASWHLPRTLNILSTEACFHPVLSVCGQHPCSTEWTLSILFVSFYLLLKASEETLCIAINCRIHQSILDCLLISTICNHPKRNYLKKLI